MMKTLTCRQLGGACDLSLRGGSADEVVQAQDRHLREAVAGGDAAHVPARDEMRGRWKHPVSGLAWYRATKRAFAAAPED